MIDKLKQERLAHCERVRKETFANARLQGITSRPVYAKPTKPSVDYSGLAPKVRENHYF